MGRGQMHAGLWRGGRIILKWILKIGWVGLDWIDLAKDRDKRRALQNAVMKLRVP
jgi:hypothetical protein